MPRPWFLLAPALAARDPYIRQFIIPRPHKPLAWEQWRQVLQNLLMKSTLRGILRLLRQGKLYSSSGSRSGISCSPVANPQHHQLLCTDSHLELLRIHALFKTSKECYNCLLTSYIMQFHLVTSAVNSTVYFLIALHIYFIQPAQALRAGKTKTNITEKFMIPILGRFPLCTHWFWQTRCWEFSSFPSL